MRAAWVFVIVFATTGARADRLIAAQHFELARAAHARGDWAAAIAEYENAYKAEPAPAPLYNIATIYERIGKLRDAARYYQRYLDVATGAKDATAVTAKLRTLRATTSKVTITSTPSGAELTVDGKPRGATPATLALEGGRDYAITAALAGVDAPPRTVTPEYGEPIAVGFDLGGTLTITSEPAGARVSVDGAAAGTSPLTKPLTPGRHHVELTADNHRAYSNDVIIPPGQTVTLDATLPEGEAASASPQGGSSGYYSASLVGGGYLASSQTSGIARLRLAFGVESAQGTVEIAALVGVIDRDAGGAGELRYAVGAADAPASVLVAGHYGYYGAVERGVGLGLVVTPSPRGTWSFYVEGGYDQIGDASGAIAVAGVTVRRYNR